MDLKAVFRATKTDGKNVLLLFVIAFFVQWIAHFIIQDFVNTDEAIYANLSANFVNQHGWITDYLSYPWEVMHTASGFLTPSHSYNFNSPLYTLLIAGQFKILGVSFASIQFLNIMIGSLTVPVIYFLGKVIFDNKTGLVAGLIIAMFPLQIFYAISPSNSILMCLFGPLSLIAAIVYQKNPDKRGVFLVFAGLFTGLAIQSRLLDGLIVLMSIAPLILYGFFKRRTLRNALWLLSGTIVLIAICAPGVFMNYAASGSPLGLRITSATTTSVGSILPAISDGVNLLYLSNPILFVLGIAGIVLFFRRSLVWLVVPLQILLYSFAEAGPNQRYTVWLIPIVVVFAIGYVIGEVKSGQRSFLGIKMKSPTVHIASICILLTIIFCSFIPQYSIFSNVSMDSVGRSSVFNYNQAYAWLNANTSSSNVIMARSPLFTFYTNRPTVMSMDYYNLSQIIDVIKFYKVHYLIIDQTASANFFLHSVYTNPTTLVGTEKIQNMNYSILQANTNLAGWAIDRGVPLVNISLNEDGLCMTAISKIGNSTAGARFDFNQPIDFSLFTSFSFSIKDNSTQANPITIRLRDTQMNQRWWNLKVDNNEVNPLIIDVNNFTSQNSGFNISSVKSIVLETSQLASSNSFAVWFDDLKIQVNPFYSASLVLDFENPRLLLIDVSPLWTNGSSS